MAAAKENADQGKGFCPVYDVECPSGSDAADSCENRFTGDYNPLQNFRDAEIEHCALYRAERQGLGDGAPNLRLSNEEKSSKDEE